MPGKRSAEALFDAVRPSLPSSEASVCNRSPPPTAATSWQAIFGRKGAPAVRCKRSAPPLKPAPTPAASEQLYLDFGQRSFGRQIHCAACGMLYTAGEPRDEQMHKKHHLKVPKCFHTTPHCVSRGTPCHTAHGPSPSPNPSLPHLR